MSKKTSDKVKVLVTIPKPEGMTKREVVGYVRSAVHEMAFGYGEGFAMQETCRQATAKEHKGEPAVEHSVAGDGSMDASTAAIVYALGLDSSEDAYTFLRYWNEGEFDTLREEWPEAPDEVYAGCDPLHSETKRQLAETPEKPASAEPSLTPVQVFNAIVRDINEISYMPPVDIRQNRREYWKAGARACLSMLNRSLQTTADRILGERRPQPIDGELFNYWIEEAGRNPSRVAKALAECSTPDDYRAALWLMIKEDEGKALDDKPLLNPEGGLV